MKIDLFLQQMVNGFSLGSMYALIAIGYTMVYGILRLINFAHGDIMALGAFFAYLFVAVLHIPFLVSFALSIGATIVCGVLIDKIAYKPLRYSPRISLLITAIGVSFLIENGLNVFVGGTPVSFNVPTFFTQSFSFSNISISGASIIIPCVTLHLLCVLLWFIYKSKMGAAIRALAFDMPTVTLMGINTDMLIAIVFGIGSALAAIGGIFYAISYSSIGPLMGVIVGLKAFAAAVVGGIGSVVGALLGGFIIGFCEILVVAFIPEASGYKDAFAFVFLIFVLLFKPTGIMGQDFEKRRF